MRLVIVFFQRLEDTVFSGFLDFSSEVSCCSFEAYESLGGGTCFQNYTFVSSVQHFYHHASTYNFLCIILLGGCRTSSTSGKFERIYVQISCSLFYLILRPQLHMHYSFLHYVSNVSLFFFSIFISLLHFML